MSFEPVVPSAGTPTNKAEVRASLKSWVAQTFPTDGYWLGDPPDHERITDDLMDVLDPPAVDGPGTERCHAGQDGDCDWSGCPQNRDGEPSATGRSCPLFPWDADVEEQRISSIIGSAVPDVTSTEDCPPHEFFCRKCYGELAHGPSVLPSAPSAAWQELRRAAEEALIVMKNGPEREEFWHLSKALSAVSQTGDADA